MQLLGYTGIKEEKQLKHVELSHSHGETLKGSLEESPNLLNCEQLRFGTSIQITSEHRFRMLRSAEIS